MKHELISLGAACDTAMILEELGLRTSSFPFDWLWNLDTGLEFVIETMESDFETVTNNAPYIKTKHFRFSEPSLVYTQHPSVIHMHSNPLDNAEDHQALVRRFRRLNSLLNSDSFLHFVYYRNHQSDTLKDNCTTPAQTLQKLLREGRNFLTTIQKKYNRNKSNTSLLLILQTNIEHDQIAKEVENIKASDFNVGFTISRYDEDPKLNTIWKRQWIKNILLQANLPTGLLFHARMVLAIKGIKSGLKKATKIIIQGLKK